MSYFTSLKGKSLSTYILTLLRLNFIYCRYGAFFEDAFFVNFTIERQLNKESITFSVPALGGVMCTLKWQGENGSGGQYALLVGETKFSELPEFFEVA